MWRKGIPSLAAITSGCATIHSLISSLRPCMTTQPPCSRYRVKERASSRSLRPGHWRRPYSESSRPTQESKIADSMKVAEAV